MDRVYLELDEAIRTFAIRDADSLLFRARDILGDLTAIAGRGEHSHAGMLSFWRGIPMCVHLIASSGGEAVTLRSLVDRQSGRIDVYVIQDELFPSFSRGGASRMMIKKSGKRYSFGGLLLSSLVHVPFVRLIFRPGYGQNGSMPDDPKRPEFCSEGLSSAEQYGGGVDPVPSLWHRNTEPCDHARSHLKEYEVTLCATKADAERFTREGWCGHSYPRRACRWIKSRWLDSVNRARLAGMRGRPGAVPGPASLVRIVSALIVAVACAVGTATAQHRVPRLALVTPPPLVAINTQSPQLIAVAPSITIAEAATCKVSMYDRSGNLSGSMSGVIVGVDKKAGMAACLTAAHGFDRDTYSVKIWPANHASDYVGTLLAKGDKRKYDVALVEFRYPTRIRLSSAVLMDRDAPAGSACELIGHPRDSRRQVFKTGRVGSGYGHMMSMSFPAIGGDSGGPVFVDGRVAGIQSSTDSRNSYATGASDVRAWLTQYYRDCPDGRCGGVQVGGIIVQPRQRRQPQQPVTPPRVEMPNDRRPIAGSGQVAMNDPELESRVTVVEQRLDGITGHTDALDLQVKAIEGQGYVTAEEVESDRSQFFAKRIAEQLRNGAGIREAIRSTAKAEVAERIRSNPPGPSVAEIEADTEGKRSLVVVIGSFLAAIVALFTAPGLIGKGKAILVVRRELKELRETITDRRDDRGGRQGRRDDRYDDDDGEDYESGDREAPRRTFRGHRRRT